jgi:hypothetical protein
MWSPAAAIKHKDRRLVFNGCIQMKGYTVGHAQGQLWNCHPIQQRADLLRRSRDIGTIWHDRRSPFFVIQNYSMSEHP